ncbi:MAG: sulfite exporter TauE/SafE family protein [Planctomycetota bacterium]|nr:sulfite exporter TauE/SafE family protein [Planctomycetota bacterium]MDI6787344.1 sulfite exporter TauE/SafE family protein [Planctomycetota bacterium]
MESVILVLIGIIIGFIGTIAGIGGGLFIVPLLVSVYHFAPQSAISTSLFVIVLTSLSSTISYARYGKINYQIGIIMTIGVIPAILLGVYISEFLSPKIFKVIFAIVLIIVAVYLLLRKDYGREEESPQVIQQVSQKNPFNLWLIFFGFLSGFMASFLGIGGGIILMPVFLSGLGRIRLPVTTAVATSHFIVLFTALFSVISYTFAFQSINYAIGLRLGLGAALGAQAGAYISSQQRWIKSRWIVIILTILLLLSALKLLL